MRRDISFVVHLTLSLLIVATNRAGAVPTTTGNVAIYRVGNGATALTFDATAVFIDEYSPAGGLVQSFPLPTSGSGAFTASGLVTSDGILSMSTNGQYLVFTGYRRAAGLSNPVAGTAVDVPRLIGRMDRNGNLDSSTALVESYSGLSIRGATSTDGTKFWLSGAAGSARYVASLGASTSEGIDSRNAFQPLIFDNQLYLSTVTGSPRGLIKYTGLPTSSDSGSTVAALSVTTSAGGFFMADLNAGVAGVDTLYLLDLGGSQLNKFSLVGGSWTLNNSISSDASNLTGAIINANVVLYATSPTTLATLTDTGGYNANITGSFSNIASAPSNTNFLGVAMIPEPALGVAVVVSLALFTRRRCGS